GAPAHFRNVRLCSASKPCAIRCRSLSPRSQALGLTSTEYPKFHHLVSTVEFIQLSISKGSSRQIFESHSRKGARSNCLTPRVHSTQKARRFQPTGIGTWTRRGNVGRIPSRKRYLAETRSLCPQNERGRTVTKRP